MGKLLESLGQIDGYDITEIGFMKAQKEGVFDELLKVDSSIRDDVINTVKNGKGHCFAISKKKVIYGVYLFEIIEKKDKEDETHRELKHVKTVYSKEVPEETREKYDSHVEELVKDFVTSLEFDNVTLEDKVVQLDPKKDIGTKVAVSIVGYLCGFVFGWLVFDDIFWGFLYGIIFMPLFNEGNILITNKRGRKKSDKKKNHDK